MRGSKRHRRERTDEWASIKQWTASAWTGALRANQTSRPVPRNRRGASKWNRCPPAHAVPQSWWVWTRRDAKPVPVWGALLPEIRQLIVDLWEYGPGNRKGLLVPGRKLYGLGTPVQRLSQWGWRLFPGTRAPGHNGKGTSRLPLPGPLTSPEYESSSS